MHVRPEGRRRRPRPGFLFTTQTFAQREKFRLMALILPPFIRRMFDSISNIILVVFCKPNTHEYFISLLRYCMLSVGNCWANHFIITFG